jgi:hypothetical protein
LLENNLGQHGARDFFIGLGVVDHEIFAVLHHLGEICKRHIGAGGGIIETPIRVLFDGDRRR